MPINLNDAIRLHQAGDLDQASAGYEALLKEHPDNADALHLLGLVSLQRGDFRRAETLIHRAIAIHPDDATFHANLGEVYFGLGQLDQAIGCYEVALKLDPDRSEIHSNLGVTLLDRGDVTAAISHLREAIRLNPDLGAVYNNLGNAYRLQGHTTAAIDQYRIAARLLPANPEILNNLGKTLLERGDLDEALRYCSQAVRIHPGFVSGLTSLGNVYQTLGQLKEAECCFREAIRLKPQSTTALAGLGGVLDEQGHGEQAEASLREVLRYAPQHVGAYARLATRLRGKLPLNDITAIDRLLAHHDLAPSQRSTLQFGLAHVYDAQHDFARAADLCLQANSIQSQEFTASGQVYNPSAHHEFVSEVIATFTADFFDSVRGFGLDSKVPVFIVGLPRSGTSLTEQILASHPQVFGAGELRLVRQASEAIPEWVGRGTSPLDSMRFLTQEMTRQLAQRHLDALHSLKVSADRVVDKMPENTLYLGLIATLFPQAKVIHCRRDSRDIALSCFMTQFRSLRWTCDPDHIASRIFESQRIMDHWRQVLPTPILEVDYEATVTDFETTARALVTFADLEWDPACLNFHKSKRSVQTASTAQVRQPIYSTSIERWRNYEHRLALLFDRLKP